MICWRRSSRAVGCAGFSSRGVDDGAGQQRRLAGSERRRRRAEVRARRRLHAVDAVAPLDHVQVQLEDPRLGQLGFEPPGDDQLAQLAQRIPRRRQIEVLGELLRDRARAAHELARAPSPASIDFCSSS